jgi:hypothetical protein
MKDMAMTLAPTLSEHLAPGAPKRMLALDGGGTLGVIEIAFLERIEALLRARYGGDPAFRLCHYFDLIGGTSTGAIIATALALGMSAQQVKALYFELGPAIFKPRFDFPGFRPKFRAGALAEKLHAVLADRKLESEDLKTGLTIVTKRVDTGSPWVLTNHPASKFWNDPEVDPVKGKAPYIGNRHYKLSALLRASTAAPFYFSPKQIQIAENEPDGLFVDGGVSAYNNPSLLLLMLANIKGYGFMWPLGRDNLMMISIGAGWSRPKIPFKRGRSMLAIRLAGETLRGVIWDANVKALTMLQWLSEPRRPWPINSEIGTLEKEFIAAGMRDGCELLSFQRYDISFEPEWIKKELGLDMSADDLARINDFMNPRIMAEAHALAAKAAAAHVDDRDFPPAFDLPQAAKAA